jgi:hypothetical protein
MIQATTHLNPTASGLEVIGKPTDEEWVSIGEQLAKASKIGKQWVVGDWFNHVPGDKRAACRRVGMAYEAAKFYGTMAIIYEGQERIEGVSWKAHQLAAPLPAIYRREVLLEALACNWSLAQVREEVHCLRYGSKRWDA